jgi:predicted nucleotidyltransferase
VQAPTAYFAGMKRRQTAEAIQYTLRNVPPALDRALRRRAKQLSKSLNEVALEALTLGAGVSHEVREQHDLDFLFGSWVEDPEVDRALADQRKIDADIWR